jgi:DNA ligase 1
MRLSDLVQASTRLAAERGRNAKVAIVAALLARLDPSELRIGTAYIAGEIPQGRIGVGWGMVRELGELAHGEAAESPSLVEIDRILADVAAASGSGSVRRRKELLGGLFARLSTDERKFLSALLLAGLRQGALAAVLLEAVAKHSGLPADKVRRAAMLAGSEVDAATAILLEGQVALARFALVPFKPFLPMLASPAEDAASALDTLGRARFEIKLDGARIQVHKDGDEVRLYSRSLHDVTSRAPEIVEIVRGLPVRRAIFDGEAIALRPDGSPYPFQVSMRRFGRSKDVDQMRATLPLSPQLFDVVLLDDDVLLDAPLAERAPRLEAIVPEHARPVSLTTDDTEALEAFYARTVAGGHEGLMGKNLASSYQAGHRGKEWLKVKPAHTIDLVVLAVERGSGRRNAWLSNIHLGARDPAAGGFAMIGKTFKGMTDEMLIWQTARFTELAVGPTDGYVVKLRPEQVVEVAFNDVQASSEYPSGVALRFARVRRYRSDKTAADTNTIDEVRALLPRDARG